MADNEREWRINDREYERLSDEQLVAILDDTGKECPDGNYTPAQVYSMARSLRANRQLLEAITAPRSPAPPEVKAKLFRLSSGMGENKPEGTREELEMCARMIDTYAADAFPANELGQIHFGRAMMESVADTIRAFLTDQSNEVKPVQLVIGGDADGGDRI